MRRVHVAVGQSPYHVLIGRDVLAHRQLRLSLGSEPSGILVSTEKIMRLHGNQVKAALAAHGFDHPVIALLPDGEAAKTVPVWGRILEVMARARLDRRSFVIALGGGSVGDAAGFAAAAYMRGVRAIQIPTTLLAMVDSSVGGKTGLNLPEGKNLIGAFHQPELVLVDPAFLRTLPARERQSGVYEILKCGILKSAPLLRLVERTRGLRTASAIEIESAIAAAIAIKARIVEGDEKETGERILLNLGHTLGHALEAATAYRTFTHGEAVGYGIEFATDLGEALGLTSPRTARRVRSVLASLGRAPHLQRSMVTAARSAIHGDKKRVGRRVRVVVFERPGHPLIIELDAEAFGTLAQAWMEARSGRTRGGRRRSE